MDGKIDETGLYMGDMLEDDAMRRMLREFYDVQSRSNRVDNGISHGIAFHELEGAHDRGNVLFLVICADLEKNPCQESRIAWVPGIQYLPILFAVVLGLQQQSCFGSFRIIWTQQSQRRQHLTIIRVGAVQLAETLHQTWQTHTSLRLEIVFFFSYRAIK